MLYTLTLTIALVRARHGSGPSLLGMLALRGGRRRRRRRRRSFLIGGD
jgi:hypothetical protein